MVMHDPAFADFVELGVDTDWRKYSTYYGTASKCTVDFNRLTTGGLQWCAGDGVANATVMTYTSNDYDAPLLQVNPLLAEQLRRLFQAGDIFHQVGKFLFQPTARVVTALEPYMHLADDCLVGVQLRSNKPLPPGTAGQYLVPRQYAAVVRAIAQQHPGNMFVAADTDIFQDMAGLFPERLLWWTNETQSTISRPLAAGGNPGSNLSAFVDLLILTRCKHIVVTAGSSFGVLAAALSGVRPVHVVRGKHEQPFLSPWFWASVSSEPCLWKASIYIPSPLESAVRVALKEQHPLYWYFEQCN